MLNQNKPTRLGEILLDRGVITRQQLREAIEIQQARQLLREKEATYPGTAAPIGEILIELGFISRQQLVQSAIAILSLPAFTAQSPLLRRDTVERIKLLV